MYRKLNINKFYSPLCVVLIIGLILRVLFSFWLSKYYFGEVKFYDHDTFSFLNSFLNLMNHGTYTFDFDFPDAYVYRGPGYSFFLGIHYLIYGEELVFKGVALSQCFIDIGSAYLIYRILILMDVPKYWATLGSAVYVFNPIFISYVPLSYTETLSTFLSLLIIYIALVSDNKKHFFILGLLCAIAVLTRQYLGLWLPIVTLFIVLQWKEIGFEQSMMRAMIVVISFSLFVAPWFLRNAINVGIPTILMGETSGYADMQKDFTSAINLYTLVMVNPVPTIKSIAKSGNDTLRDHSVFSPYEKEVREAAHLAYVCGPSFKKWRSYWGWEDPPNYMRKSNCKDEVEQAFNDVRKKIIDHNGLFFYIKIPFKNIQKSLFKSELTNHPEGFLKNILIKSIFSYRTIFILLGFISIILLFNSPKLVFMIMPVFMIFFISFVVRQVEIRYLAQAEAVLIIYATITIQFLYSYLKSIKKIS